MSYKSLLIVCIGLISTLFGKEPAEFTSTIPVVDLSEFNNPATKEQFVQKVAKAMHEVGFFGVINPEINSVTLNTAYKACIDFYSSPQELKDTLWLPHLNGQRGYVKTEIAQGNTVIDFKEFCHFGKNNNIWPHWMDFQSPMEQLMAELDKNAETFDRVFALALGLNEEYFLNMTKEGECLLRPIHYPKNPAPGSVWAAKHTDIDFFTILPVSTEEGLQVFHNGEWVDVRVPEGAFIINVGDKLQNLSNGYFKSCVHQVMAKPDLERYSIVYFVHPRNEDSMAPIPEAIALTGGTAQYPEATSFELLVTRLREINLASPELLEFEKICGIMDRVRELVESGNAAEPVKLTYSIWQEQQKDAQ